MVNRVLQKELFRLLRDENLNAGRGGQHAECFVTIGRRLLFLRWAQSHFIIILVYCVELKVIVMIRDMVSRNCV